MASLPLSVTPEERAEQRRKKALTKREIKYLADTMVVTLADIEYALKKFKGSIPKTADFFGVESYILRRKIRSNPHLVFIMDSLKEDRVDLAEDKLLEQVEAGYFPAIALTLKTLGQHRGYTERSTMEHELSDKGVKDAASLIEMMRKELTRDEMDAIDVEDYEWESAPTLTLKPDPLLLTTS
jgi:hypothetical protein